MQEIHVVFAPALRNPAAQVIHVAIEAAPIVALHVPAGQSVGFREPNGQKEPAGQISGAPVLQ